NRTLAESHLVHIEVNHSGWDTSQSKNVWVNGIFSEQPRPILILDVGVSNLSDQALVLGCTVVESRDKLETIVNVYYPTLTGAIKANENLRLVRIEPKTTQAGKLAYEVPVTNAGLWLDCGTGPETKIQ